MIGLGIGSWIDIQIDKRRSKNEKKVLPKNLAIASLMSQSRGRQTLVLSLFLLLGGLFYYFVMSAFHLPVKPEALFLLGGVFLLLQLRQFLLSKRIASQKYGHNPYEAKEFLLFVQEESEKTDFTDGGGKRKIFEDTIDEKQTLTILQGQEAHGA